MSTFRAYRIHESEGAVEARLDEIGLGDLSEGDVTIRAAWSGINYKDALAVTGKGRIMRHFPMVAGVDVSGTVESSSDDRFVPGDRVLVAGANMGEAYDGGFAERVRVPADAVVPVPEGLSLREAMALGTAGFTAALAIERMELNGQRPGNGPVLVNGATGGVGSFAVDMLAGRGYDVVAFTGKAEATQWLTSLGASRVVLRDEVEMGTRPLERAEWAGAVDNLGGDHLAWLTRTVMPGGQHRIHRTRRRREARDDGDALHSAWRESSRYQFRHHLRGAPGARVGPLRDGPETPPHRQDRDPGDRARRAPRRVRGLHGGVGHRPHRDPHRRLTPPLTRNALRGFRVRPGRRGTAARRLRANQPPGAARSRAMRASATSRTFG